MLLKPMAQSQRSFMMMIFIENRLNHMILSFTSQSGIGGLRVEWSPATRSIRVRVPADATFLVFFFFFQEKNRVAGKKEIRQLQDLNLRLQRRSDF